MTNRTAKASARKSFGEYKPLIQFSDGSTEVCEKSPERQDRYTKRGLIPGKRMARGKTYPTREEAVAVAEEIIAMRLAHTEAQFADLLNRPNASASAIAYVKASIALWSGK